MCWAKLRLRLREDVRFHDARRLTSRDVRYSFERLLKHKDDDYRWLLSPMRGAAAFANGQSEELEGFRIHSAGEFTVELDRPCSFFPAILSDQALAIVPEGFDSSARYWSDGCVGTGPFRLVRFEPNRRIELERNPLYWRKGFPRSRAVIFTITASRPRMALPPDQAYSLATSW